MHWGVRSGPNGPNGSDHHESPIRSSSPAGPAKKVHSTMFAEDPPPPPFKKPDPSIKRSGPQRRWDERHEKNVPKIHDKTMEHMAQTGEPLLRKKYAGVNLNDPKNAKAREQFAEDYERLYKSLYNVSATVILGGRP